MHSLVILALAVTSTFAQGAGPPQAQPSPAVVVPLLSPRPAPAPAKLQPNPSTVVAIPPRIPEPPAFASSPANALPKTNLPPVTASSPLCPTPPKIPGTSAVSDPKWTRPSSRPPPKAGAETLPDLSATAKMFPPGPDVRSPVLLPREPPGQFKVEIRTHPSFPNRTLYVPLNVPWKIPVFAWENGICYLYGRMYQQFLTDIASHGYLVITPGEPNTLSQTRSTADWQLESIRLARAWAASNTTTLRPSASAAETFSIHAGKVAIGGHSCGGSETVRNLAQAEEEGITTGIVMNSAGSSAAFIDVNVPMLWIHGGQTDVEDAQDRNFDVVASERPDLPVVELGIQTGHLGSFWSPRGGIYAETVRRWLKYQLSDDGEDRAWFLGGNNSSAFKRGWSSVQTNALE